MDDMSTNEIFDALQLYLSSTAAPALGRPPEHPSMFNTVEMDEGGRPVFVWRRRELERGGELLREGTSVISGS